MNSPIDTESIVFQDQDQTINPGIDVDSITFDQPDISGGPDAEISQAPPKQSAWQRIKNTLQSPDLMTAAIQGPMSIVTDAASQAAPQIMQEITRPSPEEDIARAQNIYAISQNSGVPQQDIAAHYEDLMKMSSVTGIEADPTKYEVLEKAMTLGLAPAMFAAPVPTAVGLLGFAALDAIFPTDAFIPEDASAESRDNIRLIGMLLKGGAVGGFIHAFPKAPKSFPSGAQLVEYPFESAARMRDNAVGIFKAFTKQKLTEKGLPTEIVITPEQLNEIRSIEPIKPDAVMAAEAKKARKNDARRQRQVDELKGRLLDGEVIKSGYDPAILRDAKIDAIDHINDIQAKEGKVRNKFQQIRYDLNKQLRESDMVTADLGLDSAKVETAINNGMSVKIPVENLVDVAVKSEDNFVKVQEVLSRKAGESKTQTLEPIQGTGEVKTSTLAESVEAQAIADRLATKFEDLPASQALVMEDQAKFVLEQLKMDPARARRVAMGEEPSPDPRITPEAFYVAIEEKARRDADAQTLHDLATMSKLNEASVTMGRRLRTLGEREKDSPVEAIKQVAEAREKAARKNFGKEPIEKVKQKIVKDIKKSVKKNAPTIDEWTAFLRELEC